MTPEERRCWESCRRGFLQAASEPDNPKRVAAGLKQAAEAIHELLARDEGPNGLRTCEVESLRN